MRSAVVIAAVCLCIIGTAEAQVAGAMAVKRPTHIPPEPLGIALQALASERGFQLICSAALVKSQKTTGLSGILSANEALKGLLRGSGLTYRYLDSETVTIIPVSQDSAGSKDVRAPRAAPSSLRQMPDGKNGKTSHSEGFRSAQLYQGAYAHATPPDPGTTTAATLKEVLVTAQKYRQRAFDVPISLQVIGGATIERHGITDLNQLQYEVPGLYMNSTGTDHSVYLRGVGNSVGNGAMVGQYIDDADITSETVYGGRTSGDGGLYDLNRVEILKGPQGTLYGDGSMGGVIRYITNKPVLDRFQMSANVAALFTQYGAPSQRIEPMLNAPLLSGTLGLRFAGLLQHDGGWVDEPVANLKNVNGSNLADMRVEALWRPTERLGIYAMQIAHRHTSGVIQNEDASGNFTPGIGTFTPNLEDNSNLSNLTVTYDFGVARFLSSSTYFNESQDQHNFSQELSFGAVSVGTLDPHFHVNTEDYSEEFRFVHSGESSWQWTVGGFYKSLRNHPRDEPGTYVYLGPPGASLSEATLNPGFDESASTKSWAGFADTSYKIARFTLGAGVRYFKDRETFAVVRASPFTPANFTSTDPRFYVKYRVSPHINTYVSASKGFRSGGFNAPPNPPYQPEVLWSYDLGTKMRYPEEGLRANVDLFHMNYSSYVGYSDIPPLYPLFNVGKARINGVDADATWQPANRWRFGVTTEILKTEFLTASAISGYAPGDRLPFAPTYSFTASMTRDVFWDGKPGNLELYYYEISRVQLRSGLGLSQSDMQRFLNARASIQWRTDLSFAFFADNLINNRGNESPYVYADTSIRPRPRTFGVEFSVRFL